MSYMPGIVTDNRNIYTSIHTCAHLNPEILKITTAQVKTWRSTPKHYFT